MCTMKLDAFIIIIVTSNFFEVKTQIKAELFSKSFPNRVRINTIIVVEPIVCLAIMFSVRIHNYN